jgi:hypothetical protein
MVEGMAAPGAPQRRPKRRRFCADLPYLRLTRPRGEPYEFGIPARSLQLSNRKLSRTRISRSLSGSTLIVLDEILQLRSA